MKTAAGFSLPTRITETEYPLPRRARLRVAEGDIIEPGTQLTEGPLDPKEVLEIRGVRAAQRYLVDQVQEVYRSQGVDIHDKHIELIVRQMLRKVRVVNSGDSHFLPAELIDEQEFRDVNRSLVEEGKAPGRGSSRADGYHQGFAWLRTRGCRPLRSRRRLGFSPRRRCRASRTSCVGLKENVIIGKLIPAGTGSTNYQSIQPSLPDATVVSALGLFGDEMPEPTTAEEALPADPAQWLASLGAQDGDGDDE